MTWHYLDDNSEPCTYSPEPVEASSQTSSSVTVPSALSSLIPTVDESSSPASETDTSPASPYGMTSAPSTGDRGEEMLTSSREDSPVKTSPALARAPESTASAPGFGARWREWFARYDPDSSSWKTPQCSLLGGLAEFSETWPRWGLMRGGECWERRTRVPRTGACGSGSWPTIRSADAERGGRGDLIAAVRGNPNSHYKSRGEPKLSAQVKQWPTPTKQDASNDGGPSQYSRNSLPLNAAVKFPTPRAPSKSGGGIGLDGGAGARSMLTEKDRKDLCGGQLNPRWVEWLMGFPIGWVSCEHSGMRKFRKWLRSHGRS